MTTVSVIVDLMSLVTFVCVILQTVVKSCHDSQRFCWFVIILAAGTAVGCWYIHAYTGMALFLAVAIWTLCLDLPPLQKRQAPPTTPPKE